MTIELIPLGKLIPSTANVRKTGSATGLEELGASVKVHGLSQNLHMQAASGGNYEVVAGGRRRTALKRLARG